MHSRNNIEDIILSHDNRGISALRPYLPSDFCYDAAELILKQSRQNSPIAFITSGFYIPSAKNSETDGPLGTFALARAMTQIGYRAILITDRYSKKIFTLAEFPLIVFPIKDEVKSLKFAYKLLKEHNPSIIISVERCGMTSTGKYLNMRGADISEYNAKIDYLFMEQENTIGIGDGGNEIGMGNLADKIRLAHNLPAEPCITTVKRLIIASVSNWGAYGLIAALSLIKKQNLLPPVDWERQMLKQIVDSGAVDGISGKKEYSVDGFPIEENCEILKNLNETVSRKLNIM